MKPTWDVQRFKVWKLPHPLLMHWVLNPGIALSELVLGQRMPRVMLIDKTSDAPLVERSYVPCPECNTLNDGRIWGADNGFGHWLGYVCPECGGKIPCLWNVFSIVIVFVTAPLWFVPWKMSGERWLRVERMRAQEARERLADASASTVKHPFMRGGILFGTAMFAFFLAKTVSNGRTGFTDFMFVLILAALSGIMFGALTWLLVGRRKRRSE